MEHRTDAQPSGEFHAVITRANGDVEHLGRLAATYRNPLRRIWWQLYGQPRAGRRIAKANRRAAELRAKDQEEDRQ